MSATKPERSTQSRTGSSGCVRGGATLTTLDARTASAVVSVLRGSTRDRVRFADDRYGEQPWGIPANARGDSRAGGAFVRAARRAKKKDREADASRSPDVKHYG